MKSPKIRIAIEDSVTRECKVCKITKQLNTEFTYKISTDLYYTYCKDCDNLRRRTRYAGLPDPEEFKVLVEKKPRVPKVFENKPWRKTTFANRKRLDYRSVDKKKGLENDITTEFIENALNSPCHYCGSASTGLDRIDNKKGHLMDNSLPCCYECNILRNNVFSVKEMLIIGKVIKEIKEARKNGCS